jgi:hypothetical protein
MDSPVWVKLISPSNWSSTLLSSSGVCIYGLITAKKAKPFEMRSVVIPASHLRVVLTLYSTSTSETTFTQIFLLED